MFTKCDKVNAGFTRLYSTEETVQKVGFSSENNKEKKSFYGFRLQTRKENSE